MAELYNNGTLKLNKRLTIRALETAKKLISSYLTVDETETELSFSGVPGYIETELNKLIDAFAEKGYTIEGEVEYEGDYRGGFLIRKGEHCVRLREADVVLKNTGDEELADVLRKRGYVVIKQRASVSWI